MIPLIFELFTALVQEMIAAGDDREKQQAALMSAEEKLAHARAKAKFG